MWDNEDLFGFKICPEEGRGRINLTSTLGKIIFDLASKSENVILVEIGTWNGLGSTKCFIEGLLINKESRLFSVENNQEKIDFARKIWTPFIQENNLNVEFLNGTLVPNHVVDKWLLENNVELLPDQLIKNRWEKFYVVRDKDSEKKLYQKLNPNNEKFVIIHKNGSIHRRFNHEYPKNNYKKIYVENITNNMFDFLLVEENLLPRGGYRVFRKK